MTATVNNSPAGSQQTPIVAPMGNIANVWLLGVALTPVIVATITVAEQTFTVAGLNVGDFVSVTKPTTQAGLGIAGARVSAANTLAIAFVNPTAAGITPTAAEVYQIRVERPLSGMVSNLPTSLPLTGN